MLKLHSYSICSVPSNRLLIAFCLVLIFLNHVWSYCDWYRAHCIDWLYKLSCYLFRKHNRRSQELCVSSPMMTSICTSAALVYSLSLQTTMGQTSSCSRIQTLAYTVWVPRIVAYNIVWLPQMTSTCLLVGINAHSLWEKIY